MNNNGTSIQGVPGQGASGGSTGPGTDGQIAVYGVGNAIAGDALFTDNGITLAYAGTGGITAAKAAITTGDIFVGNGVVQIVGSGDIEIPLLNVRMDSNAGAFAGIAVLIENASNFAHSIDLVTIRSHNAGDSCDLLHMDNSGTGNYISCGIAVVSPPTPADFTVSKAGKATALTFAALSLTIHANNAAATGAGLVAGDFYRTGADPDVVCVVH